MRARLAKVDDYAAIFAMAEHGHGETRYGRYPVAPQKFEQIAQLCEAQPENVFCVVAEAGDGQLMGFMVGVVTPHLFADMIYSSNLAIYVASDFRGSPAAPLLIVEFERQSWARDADEIQLGVSSGVEPERTFELYKVMGYEIVGSVAVKYRSE